MTVPGFCELYGGCYSQDGKVYFAMRNTTTEPIDAIVDQGTADPTTYRIQPAESAFAGTPYLGYDERIILQMNRGDKMATVIATLHNSGSTCLSYATATIS